MSTKFKKNLHELRKKKLSPKLLFAGALKGQIENNTFYLDQSFRSINQSFRKF